MLTRVNKAADTLFVAKAGFVGCMRAILLVAAIKVTINECVCCRKHSIKAFIIVEELSREYIELKRRRRELVWRRRTKTMSKVVVWWWWRDSTGELYSSKVLAE